MGSVQRCAAGEHASVGTDMAARIDQYWADVFGLSPGFDRRDGVLVTPHVRKNWKDNFAFVFAGGSACVISVSERRVEAVRKRTGSVSPRKLLTPNGARTLFDDPVDWTVGPAFQGYAEAEDFRPVHSDHVRRLGHADDDRLKALAEACDSREWEHSCTGFSRPNHFGLFAGDEVVAVAHYDMWAPQAAGIGVITHPAHRGRSCGKVVVSAAMKHAFEQGHLVVYQTLLANTPSVRLASILGCRQYARTMAIHLQEPDNG